MLNIKMLNDKEKLVEGQHGKLEMLVIEIERQELEIVGLSETRWIGEGSFQHDDNTTIIYSGKPSGIRERGVAMILRGEARRALIGYTTISERIMAIRLFAKPKNLTLLQVYAPTATKKNERAIDNFYEELQTATVFIKKEDICIVMGDLNAKVGHGEDKQCGIGMHGLGTRNESGDKLAEFCLANNLTIANTWFKHHPRNTYTWKSPGDLYRNQIDYIMTYGHVLKKF